MPQPDDPRTDWADLGTAWIMVAELISAVLTWGGIGWLLDRWLRTEPWLVLVGIVIGSATGSYLVYLRSQGMIGQGPTPRPSPGRRMPGSQPTNVGGSGGTLPRDEGAAHGTS